MNFCNYIFLVFFILTHKPVSGNSELKALMELKASLDPENKLLKSWTDGGDPCSGWFEGVACNEHHKVANISLQGKGLTGKLSPAVAELKCLSGLYLHYNALSGEIPKEIANLTELSDLYLNVNKLTGSIPPEICGMAALQVVELCCNQLTGDIPSRIGSLKKLTVLSLQHNGLTGDLPESLPDSTMLRRVDLSFNRLTGIMPEGLASIPHLEALDVRNNSLSGIVPSGFKRLNQGFRFEYNPGLCGVGFPSLRACTPFDHRDINQVEPFGFNMNKTGPVAIPEPSYSNPHCNRTQCSNSSKLPALAGGVAIGVITILGAGFSIFFCYRRQKQKIGHTSDPSDERFSTDQEKEVISRNGGSGSPLVCLEYSNRWDTLGGGGGDGGNGVGVSHEHLNSFKFSLEEIESATQCFSESNLLGRGKFSCVYKGFLRDGSIVAIKTISITSCKNEGTEFVKGLSLLTLLQHENLVSLRGFCCSRSRGECLLLYGFSPKGKLSEYLDVESGSSHVLDWSTRVSIIRGIAKGIEYLHRSEGHKPTIVHRNISVEKVFIDQQFKPLIADSGLNKLLADDVVFSALKTSAAMGYLAPEYITTGRFTEKSDIFAFGVIILQILFGQTVLSNSRRLAAESCKYDDFIDPNLKGEFSELEARKLVGIGLVCTDEHPNNRPMIEAVIQELEFKC